MARRLREWAARWQARHFWGHAGLRGIRAKEAIANGEEVVMIRRDRALWVTPRSSCPFPDWVNPAFYKAAPWFVKLALKVLHEKRLGSSSKLKDYIGMLPDCVDTPHFWTAEERSALHCDALRASVAAQSQMWQEQHESLMRSSPACGVSKAEFDWALACVVSRTFSGPFVGSTVKDRLNLLTLISGATAVCLTLGLFPEEKTIGAAFSAVAFNLMYELILSRNVKQYALCPVIDLLNHDSSITAEVSYDYFRDSYAVLAGRQFKPGDQVFISYGLQTADTLLQYYGFVEESNANDVYTFHDFAALLIEVRPQSAALLNQLKTHSDADVRDALGTVRITDTAQVEDSVKCALRYALGIAASVESARDKVSNAKDAVMWAAVLEVCDLEYARQPTTLRGERKALKEASRLLSDRRRLAMQYNIAKKAFLEARIEQLRVRVTKMTGV